MARSSAWPAGRGLAVIRNMAALRDQVEAWRRAGQSVALVPTMGALHDGHLTLIDRARQDNDRVVASIFVNPRQFGPNEDLAAYPRDEEGDSAKLAGRGCDLLWAPPVEVMYPAGFATTVAVAGLTQDLCGAVRPGHFDGVATVVAKLLGQVRPDRAYFGEKDWQQLQVIRRLAADLDLGVRIEGVPTVREADGLAMSSRNAYLTPDQRRAAPVLHQVLNRVANAAQSGPATLRQALAAGEAAILEAGFSSIDYLTLRDAATLAPLDQTQPGRPARVLVAARLGKARLIDNLAA